MLKITKTRIKIRFTNDEECIYNVWKGDTVPADDAQLMLDRFEGDDSVSDILYEYYSADEDRWYSQAEVNEINDVWRRFHYR